MTARALLALALALPLVATPAAGADEAPGVCVDASGAASACAPSVVTCGPGTQVTVEVFGFGEGTARCGGAVAYCRTLELSYCRGDDWATTTGRLSCLAEPFEPTEAVAVCSAPSVVG